MSRLLHMVIAFPHQSTDGLSVSLTGSRSPDDRRRRRLATAGEAADAGDLDGGGIAILRERLGELPSASPWLPRQLWKRNLLFAALWLGIAGVVTVLLRPLPPHPQIAPAVEHLTQGVRPILGVYADIALWTLAGQFAGLVGWYRSHNQSDFQGRYRVWAWAAGVLTAWGFFAGTSLHTAIAAVAAPQLRWPLWRGDVLVWLIPTALTGLSLWWMVDRDLQRNRWSLWLVRSAALVLTCVGAGELFATDLQSRSWFSPTLTIGQFVGMSLLISGLWHQAWFVAYVSTDPPEVREPIPWRARAITLLGWFRWLGWLSYLWPFRRREAAKPKRRTAKKDDADEEAAPKRRRKTAAKKRTTKSRTRVKPEPEEYEEEEAEYEEEATDESWEETDEAATDSEEEWTEEYEEEEPPPPPVKTPVRAPAPVASTPAKQTPPPPPQKPVTVAKSQPADEYDDEDSDDTNYRTDSGHTGADMFKGLSKRQRRELKKQMKDQNR